MARQVTVAVETYPIAGRFVIARGAKTQAVVVTCTIAEDGATGRGECVPYARYGETIDTVCEAIERAHPALERGATRQDVSALMPAGAARNAVDCALWDLEAKIAGSRAWELAGLSEPVALPTAVTVSLGTAEEMAAAAARLAERPLIKVKVGAGDDDGKRIAAVRRAAPDSRIILDANEGWSERNLQANLDAAAEARVELIEQPLPAGKDEILAQIARPVPLCADESVHGIDDLAALRSRYDAVNIKLDKTGGLTAALAMAERARALGFDVMVGCMVGTSLAMAPAVLIAQGARFVDLDGPLLLVRDRDPALRYNGSTVHPPAPELWG